MTSSPRAARGRPQQLEVVVDRLVLHGVPPEQADAVTAAFRQHLAALARGDTPPGRTGATEGEGPGDAAALGRRAAARTWHAARTASGRAG